MLSSSCASLSPPPPTDEVDELLFPASYSAGGATISVAATDNHGVAAWFTSYSDTSRV